MFHIFSDNEKPEISGCPSNQSRDTDPGNSTSVWTWDLPIAVDNADPSVRVACTPEPGSEFAVGVTDVICEAADKNENVAVCIFTVNVKGILLAAGTKVLGISSVHCMRYK